MKSDSEKFYKVTLRLPSSETILYVLIITVFMLIFLYLLKPSIVVPTRIKPTYREYVPRYFSDFVSIFYSILVLHSAFKPIWFIFWPLLFYCVGKRFFKDKRMKYFLAIIGFLLSYAFYAIANHSIVPLSFVYKPSAFSIDKEFPELCSERNLMVFAPPDIYLMAYNPMLEWYIKFKEEYSDYVGLPIHYVCVGNGTSVNIDYMEWNSNRSYCPDDVKIVVSTDTYKNILNSPPSLFPMFVFDCEYTVSPYQSANNRKEWKDIFCFHSKFATFHCFLHFLNPSTGVYLPPKQDLY